MSAIEGGSAGRFELSHAEKALVGLSYEGDVLAIGPSGGRRVSVAVGGTISAAIAISFILLGLFGDGAGTFNGRPIANGGALALLGATLAVYGSALSWSQLRQRLIASPEGLHVRHGLTRAEHFDWSRVVALRLNSEQLPPHVHTSSTSLELTMRWASQYDWPLVVLTDGSILGLEGLATTSAAEGWSASGVSGADQRLEALRRYRASLDLSWPDLDSTAPPRRTLPRGLERVLGMALAAVVVFGFHFWIT